MGVVVNAVPQSRMEFVSEALTGFLAGKGIKVYAVLPEDRLLASVSVAELVERLNGRVIVGQDHMDDLVENVMVGAMSVENALNYFRRKPNKVVITGGDRPDIQILALETSTKCLILTGNLEPSPMILGRAEELSVPVVLVSQIPWPPRTPWSRPSWRSSSTTRRRTGGSNDAGDQLDYAGLRQRPGPGAQVIGEYPGRVARPAPTYVTRSTDVPCFLWPASCRPEC